MISKEHIVRIFVASPCDVSEERNCLKRIIQEMNVLLSRILKLRLELVCSDTHVRPGFGSDPQDVINTQIGDEYEIFIGIMWSRFGTPTARDESGTHEEFMRAYNRYKANPSNVHMMLYFRNSDVPMERVNKTQLRKVRSFKSAVGKMGGFYREYNDILQFEQLVKLHLAEEVQYWHKSLEKRPRASSRQEETLLNKHVSRVQKKRKQELLALVSEIQKIANEILLNTKNAVKARKRIASSSHKLTETVHEAETKFEHIEKRFRNPENKAKVRQELAETLEAAMRRDKNLIEREQPKYRKAVAKVIDRMSMLISIGAISFSHDKRPSIDDLVSITEREMSYWTIRERELREGVADLVSQIIPTANLPVFFRSYLNYLEMLCQEYSAILCIWRDLRGVLTRYMAEQANTK